MKHIILGSDNVRSLKSGQDLVVMQMIKPAALGFTYEDGSPARKPAYRQGSILYVSESWKSAICDPAGGGYALTDLYLYEADEPIDTTGMMVEEKWHPAIKMPKDAARLFVQVIDVQTKQMLSIDKDKLSTECDNAFVEVNREMIPFNRFTDLWSKYVFNPNSSILIF